MSFYAYMLRCSDGSYYIATPTRSNAGSHSTSMVSFPGIPTTGGR
ncbi:hypothetical protein [Sphingomonas sp. OK281]|nr:hypothetical protein [Sphingomonas sp. OK281]SFO01099.1 hypothetical protein SAMN05428984_1599 [Sphingomonas sp. OK281]